MEIDINEKNISIEESVEILNHFFNMKDLNTEHAYFIGFDSKSNIVGIFLVSAGTVNKCFFYRRNIATFLILSGTESFALYHNHPNGTLEVSENDKNSLMSIEVLADTLEVNFIDSVIISKNGWRIIKGERIFDYEEDDEF